MVADLEQIHRLEEVAGEKRGFDGCFGVASQQRGEPAELENEHDRAVVDVALRERRNGVGLGGVEHAR